MSTPAPGPRRSLLAITTTLLGLATTACLLPLMSSQAAATDAATVGQSLPASSLPSVEPPRPSLTVSARASSLLTTTQLAAGLHCETTRGGLPLCGHGEDTEPAGPAGNDGHSHAAAGTGTATPRGTASQIGCYGDGTSGPRVRAVYARPEGSPSGYAAAVPSIRAWAAGISGQFDSSAARTGGRRHVRFATTPGASCSLIVLDVVLPQAAFATFRATVEALEARGLNAAHSKYLVWADASGFCGMATSYDDDRPGLDNINNGALPGYARIDKRCWGKVETHELVHMLGGVQRSAPNATAGFHCSDGIDTMCYDDGTAGSRQRAVCGTDRAHLLDCRNDDYFSTAAPRGSYLQTHWNTARSSFLSATLSDPAATQAPPPAASPKPVASPQPTASPTRAPAPVSPAPTPGSTRTVPSVVVPTLPAVPALPTLAPVPTLLAGGSR